MNRSHHSRSISRARLRTSQTTEIASWQTPDSVGLGSSNSQHADRNTDGWPELLSLWYRTEDHSRIGSYRREVRYLDSSRLKPPRNDKLWRACAKRETGGEI